MPKITWDQDGNRIYETGTSKAVLFVKGPTGAYLAGVAWNGLQSVKKSNDGGEENALYADNMKYLALMSAENLKGSIDAYTYPEEFEECDGSASVNPGVYVGQQTRTGFGLAWSTIVGNDTQGNAYGEKIHIVYNAKVSPSERAYQSVNDTPDAITFSWNFTTTPIDLSAIGLEPSAGIVISKSEVGATAFAALQDLLYGTVTVPSALPTIQEIIAMTESTTSVEVASLTVSAAASSAGNVTVTLNGVGATVALLTSDNTPTLVATKIRATTFAGWTTGGTGATVTFTATTGGVKTDATYSEGATGATGAMTTTTQGA
jgi:hypothetical protein